MATEYGILTRAVYEAWDKVSPPAELFHPGVGAPGVLIINEVSLPSDLDWTHVKVSWEA
jgi:hypothetical protein